MKEKTGLGKIGYINNYRAVMKRLSELMAFSKVSQADFDALIESQIDDASTFINDEGEVCPKVEATGRIFRTQLKTEDGGKDVFIAFNRSDRNPLDWVGAQLVTEDGVIDVDADMDTFIVHEGGNVHDFEKSLHSIVECAPLLLSELKWEMESKGFRWEGKPKFAIKNMKSITVIPDGHPQPVDFIVTRKRQSDAEYLSKAPGFLLKGVDAVARVEQHAANSVVASLFDFAYVPEYRYAELAEMALPERWTLERDRPYGVLINYLKYTFERACKIPGALIQVSGQYAIFNTGLVDKNYEWIYAYFEPNQISGKQKWFLYGFCAVGNRGDSGLGKKVAAKVSNFPCRVTWLSPEQLYFDITYSVYPDWTHIIKQRIDRLPAKFILRYIANQKISELYDRLGKCRTNKVKYFSDVENCVKSLVLADVEKFARYKGRDLSNWDIDRLRVDGKEYADLQRVIDAYAIESGRETQIAAEIQSLVNTDEFDDARFELVTRLNAAVALAQKKVSWDYATAVPIYYPTNKTFGFLLPLSLLGTKATDVALVLSKGRDKVYQGQTILTREMAYSNARLLRKPDAQWMFQWAEEEQTEVK